ncbi:glutamate carboxypeptidase [Deinobacterium chartae]|uniref:Glutamate carboxypeptidase n=1 Tax=Deinobacterium chartae TaxID=521158 RepID=A0A841I1J5_9DEIO|nr:M20 family metallopeptidase [Deinobacterium chartae]MBB6097825.1 glutamate carboxypeptidase [Deinobacterium chartae]
MRDLLSYLQQHQEDLLSDLRRLVEIESPSAHPERVEAVMDVVSGWMAELGAQERRFASPNGDHRHYVLEGQSSERVLILAHADTVWPVGTLERLPFRLEGDRAYGPGSYDMKAGVVQAVWALRALRQQGELPRTVELLLTSDEEIGSETSKDVIRELAQGAERVLVVEPSNPETGTLKTARKGVGYFTVSVEGRAAHAGGQPERGVNAILELARQAIALSELARPELGTTLSVGQIRGGTATNVIPAFATMEVDLRVTRLDEAARVEAAAAALRPVDERARLILEGGLERPPFERTEGTARLFEQARLLAAELGYELGEAASGGGSDGNYTAPIAPTLDGLGACGDGAHADHEHVIVPEMPRRAALLAGLIAR